MFDACSNELNQNTGQFGDSLYSACKVNVSYDKWERGRLSEMPYKEYFLMAYQRCMKRETRER